MAKAHDSIDKCIAQHESGSKKYKAGGKVSDAVQRRIDAAPKARENLKKHAKNIIEFGLDAISLGKHSAVKDAIKEYGWPGSDKRRKYNKIKKTQKAVDKGEII